MNIRFLSLLLLGLTIGLGYFVEQSDFLPILAMYSLFFAAYIYVCKEVKSEAEVNWFLATAVLLRVALLFTVPNLSDDIYRFVWDGRLILNGINPFDHLPTYYLIEGNEVPGLTQWLYDELNSPEYFTIYPPVCQGIFAFSSFLFPESILATSIFMKSILVLFEIGTLVLLVTLIKHFAQHAPARILNPDLPIKNVLLYALNPLIIIEISGNLHFEGPMVFFLLLAFWLLMKNKNSFSAIAFAFSIASKLLPLLFLPLLIFRLGWKKVFVYFTIIGIALIALFIPLVNSEFLNNFGSSLNLYFQSFEFNASTYYFLRWLGFQLKGYNLIGILGPLLALTVFVTIMIKSFRERLPDFWNLPLSMLFGISIYLFLSTTVHPWYLALPIVLCVFTKFRFPIIWSFFIFGTYINYSYPEYFENLWVVGLEYAVVFGVLIWEVYFKKQTAKVS